MYNFCGCSFIGRLFRHALEDSRPKSVLVNSLSVCISLLDPKRLTFGVYHAYNRQIPQGSTIVANPETVEGMLESLSKGNFFFLFSFSVSRIFNISPDSLSFLILFGNCLFQTL